MTENQQDTRQERWDAGHRDVYTQAAFDLGSHTDNYAAISIIRDALNNYQWVTDVYVDGWDRGNDTLAEIRFSFQFVPGDPIPAEQED